MSVLVLVRQSLPEIDPDLDAAQWHLSETGRLRCKTLADRLAAYDPHGILASTEPKAAETGKLVANVLELPFSTAAGLQEHNRTGVDWFAARDEYEVAIARFFEQPESLVFGLETADQVYQRFASGLALLIERHAGQNLAVVSHGTVIALFVSRAMGQPPFPLWKRLATPSFVVLSLPEFSVLEVVETVR